MAQALTGHGCFQEYLWSKGRELSPDCPHCLSPMDTAEHTIFDCPYWADTRAELTRSLGRSPQPADVQDLLCGPTVEELPNNHAVRSRLLTMASRLKMEFCAMVEAIMDTKQSLERDRQRQHQD